jgi:hypothetical protein
VLDAANHYQTSNPNRLISYQRAPETNGPFQDDHDLPTRGAIWEFLRYAADRRGGSIVGRAANLMTRCILCVLVPLAWACQEALLRATVLPLVPRDDVGL